MSVHRTTLGAVAIFSTIGALFWAPGCVKGPPKIEAWQTGALSFVQDGQLRRDDAVLRLGVPAAEFENGRILCYRLAGSNDCKLIWPRPLELRSMQPTFWESGRTPPAGKYGVYSEEWRDYSLVLVFDEAGVLRRHVLHVSTPLQHDVNGNPAY